MSTKSRKKEDINEDKYLEQLIRVNHAGEYGAKRIYEGQLAILKNSPEYSKIKHMKDQELEHLEYFEDEISKRQIRPTALQPFWHVAGFALGAATAAIGEKAAYACTVAVEEVIDEHYQSQLDNLDEKKHKKLKDKIRKFQADELEHKETGLANDAEQAPAYEVLTSAIKLGSKAAIWLAKRY